MLTGSEASIVARTGTTAIKGLRGKVPKEPDWPSLHEALMELHAILDEWCGAAEVTVQELNDLLDGAENYSKIVFLQLRTEYTFLLRRTGYVEGMQQDINWHLSPRAPLLRRWMARSRKRAARRSLSSMMRIYCPELLSDFEKATRAREEWVVKNREHLKKALKNESVDHRSLGEIVEEAYDTSLLLAQARASLAELIREKYPLGDTPPHS